MPAEDLKTPGSGFCLGRDQLPDQAVTPIKWEKQAASTPFQGTSPNFLKAIILFGT